MPSLIEIGLLVLEKMFFNINICKYGFPYCGPSRPPRDHNVNNFESTLYQKAFM